ncbi:MAG: site-2 protease family protein [Clostridia bacterium]|nr:site-2 protease family protein [Clostridia bacterium]
MNELVYYAASIIAMLFVLIPHEFAHALIAYKNGDMTAKLQGRLTLNPVKHLSPVGFLLCILTGFGWAKPVPINSANFRKYRKGLFTTAIAGVVTNYIIAFIVYPICLVIDKYVYTDSESMKYLMEFFYNVFYLTFAYGLSIIVFNILPFYPLDGFRVVESLTKETNPIRRFLQKYGRYILIFLIVESYVCYLLTLYTDIPNVEYFDIFGYFRKFATNVIGWPIKALWNWIIL